MRDIVFVRAELIDKLGRTIEVDELECRRELDFDMSKVEFVSVEGRGFDWGEIHEDVEIAGVRYFIDNEIVFESRRDRTFRPEGRRVVGPTPAFRMVD